MTTRIDADWLAARPLPAIPQAGDKNIRGRVLAIGGAEFVPGALRLTGEAALRAGAGKLQMATVRAAAMPLGVLVPEAAMIALPEDGEGEIALEAADMLQDAVRRSDVTVLGPGMSANAWTEHLVARLLAHASPQQTIILDAAALTCAAGLEDCMRAGGGAVIMTPHHGELALLLDMDKDEVAARPLEAAEHAAARFGATILLKGAQTWLAEPGEPTLVYEGGCIGLATGGSGDVLAGLIAGLCARGTAPATAAAWGCFIHGEAGSHLSKEVGEIGFLARDILPLIPRLLDARHARRSTAST